MTARKEAPVYRGWTVPDRYVSKPSDLDACPECGGPKTKHGTVCIACRRRIGRASRPASDRFWEKVAKGEGCWEWQGARDPHGYGRFQVVTGTTQKANRFAYELTNGPVPTGLYVLHHCDNPPCVNPAHLYAGTQRDNVRDMVARGRQRFGGRSVA